MLIKEPGAMSRLILYEDSNRACSADNTAKSGTIQIAVLDVKAPAFIIPNELRIYDKRFEQIQD